MTTTRADVLTIVFQAARRQRRVTYTNVRYGVTWNRLVITLGCGDQRAYDRINIIDVQAETTHHAQVRHPLTQTQQ